MLFGKKKRRIERLLLVEDEPLVAFDTEHFLRDADFEVVATVDSIADALAVINADRDIELVLVDISLSDGSGIEVARAAHALGIAVLFVTGNCPGEARAIAAGCLSKPYPQRDLIAAIEAIEAVTEGQQPKRLPQSFALFPRAA